MNLKDTKPGIIKTCQVCNSKNVYEVLDLGYSGLCDSLLNKNQLKQREKNYPLKLMRCKKCQLLQLNYVVDNQKFFTSSTLIKVVLQKL